MRDIKFKAKTIGNEWVFGNVSHLKKNFSTVRKGHYISNSAGAPFAFMVRPETICQFTGLQDKNGVDIYEGDILSHSYHNHIKGEVSFFEGSFIIGNPLTSNSLINFNAPKFLEIIGSIHTTPELLNPSNK